MKSVLFVCLGNICRSPLAEGILRYKAEELELKVKIDSAGTESYHVGEHPDKRSIQVAEKNGINISRLIARRFTREDFRSFDCILVVDSQVYREVINLADNEEERRKVDFIMNFLNPDSNQIVPDPYYGGIDGFEKIFVMLDKACDAIISQIQS